jgi:hypothetical protein
VLNSINIRLIPQEQHKFTTIGYWEEDTEGNVTFYITKLSDWRYIVCTLLHELIEWAWCKANGVTTEMADRFDETFEEQYRAGTTDRSVAPGSDSNCPYYWGHFCGNIFDSVAARILKVDEEKMDAECGRLMGID